MSGPLHPEGYIVVVADNSILNGAIGDIEDILSGLGITAGGGGGGGSSPAGVFRGMIFNDNAAADQSHNNCVGMNPQQIGGTYQVWNSAAAFSGTVAQPASYRLVASGSGTCYLTDATNVVGLPFVTQFESWAQLSATGTGRTWMGFGQYATLDHTNPTGYTLAFRYDTSVDSNWQAYCTDASNHTVVDTGVAADTNFHKFTIKPDGSGGWNFLIDGTQVANIPSGSSGLPSASQFMTPVLFVDGSNGGSPSLIWNYFGWWA
jgi:hypothetical protein